MNKHNILLVCDHRNTRDWGCRSSSIALGQILGCRGEIDTLSRDLATKRHPSGPLRSYINRGRHGRTVSRAIRKIDAFRTLYRLIGGRDDYVFRDPARTLNLFRKEAKLGNSLLADVQQRFEKSDSVVVNGGNTLMFDSTPRREMLFQLFAVELAASLGKPVYYLNGMIGDGPSPDSSTEMQQILLRTLSKCRSVSMNDPHSMKYLAEMGLSNVQWFPDALFTWRTRYAPLLDSGLYAHTPEMLEAWPDSNRIFGKKESWPAGYICLSAATPTRSATRQTTSIGLSSSAPGTRIKTGHPETFYEKLITGLMKQTGLTVVVADPSGDEFLRPLCERLDLPFVPSTANLFAGTGLLAGARAFVGGRYHPAIMASLGGTPCTFLQGKAYEADRLQHVLEYDTSPVFPVDEDKENIQAIIDYTAAKIAEGDTLRKKLINQAHKNSYKARYGLCSSLSNPG